MATIKQQKVIAGLTENHRTKGELLESAGYSKSMQEQPSRVLESKGIQELIEKADAMGITDDLSLKRIKEAIEHRDIRLAVDTIYQWFKLKYPQQKSDTNIAVAVQNITYSPEDRLAVAYELVAKDLGKTIEELKSK